MRDKGGVHSRFYQPRSPAAGGRYKSADLPLYHASHYSGPGRSIDCPITVADMDDTLEQPKPPSNLNTFSTRDEDCEQDSSGDEDGGLDWTKLPYVHPST